MTEAHSSLCQGVDPEPGTRQEVPASGTWVQVGCCPAIGNEPLPEQDSAAASRVGSRGRAGSPGFPEGGCKRPFQELPA